jgi:(p)ppGpp synthase/HD superfamily hydrolase
MIEKAILFGRYAHRDQVRKGSGDAYWTHTERVGWKAMSLGLDEDVVAAAFLHDTIEDTGATVELLTSLFNANVAKNVWWLSDQSKKEDGNRKDRKAIDRAHIAQASSQIKTVKLIDSEDNLIDIRETDRNFAKVYFQEKRDLLEVLRDGDIRMVNAVQDLIDDYFSKGH